MAISIVADDSRQASPKPGIAKSSRWFCDIYEGTAECLIAGGVLAPTDLAAQEGRPAGTTVFLPSGAACPRTEKAWREPGYRTVRFLENGCYSVRVTVGKATQQWRKNAERRAEERRLQDFATAEMAKYSGNFPAPALQRKFDFGGETWEGTKAQLQAAGLACGTPYPGEAGAGNYRDCNCPLGFEFRIRAPRYDPAKAAAGIFVAHSLYVPKRADAKEFVAYTADVLREIWSPALSVCSDIYYGSAEALVAGNLVPALELFPGQPGVGKTRVAYLADMRRADPGQFKKATLTIEKLGNLGRFRVDIPVSEAELERRRTARDAQYELLTVENARLCAERKAMRKVAEMRTETCERFFDEAARMAEVGLSLLTKSLDDSCGSAFTFSGIKGSALERDLNNAFETIRRVMREAQIVPSAIGQKLLSPVEGPSHHPKASQMTRCAAGHLRLVARPSAHADA